MVPLFKLPLATKITLSSRGHNNLVKFRLFSWVVHLEMEIESLHFISPHSMYPHLMYWLMSSYQIYNWLLSVQTRILRVSSELTELSVPQNVPPKTAIALIVSWRGVFTDFILNLWKIKRLFWGVQQTMAALLDSTSSNWFPNVSSCNWEEKFISFHTQKNPRVFALVGVVVSMFATPNWPPFSPQAYMEYCLYATEW